jgi:paraquat-inducible protein B
LSGNADHVDVRLVVWRRYAALVRSDSRFWAVGGVDVKGGLLSGVEVKLESLRGLVSGEIAFATPDRGRGAPARDGARFALADEPRKEWLLWAPRIPISPAGAAAGAEESRLPTGKDLLEAKLK